MRLRVDTLFGRLFGVLLIAIVLAHLLAFFWFHHYGPPPPPRPSAPGSTFGEQRQPMPERFEPRPPRPWFGGPIVPLTFQFISLIIAAWYGAKLLTRPIQRLSAAAEQLSEDLNSPPLDESGPKEAR